MGCQNGGSDWFEVWLVVIGAILGAVAFYNGRLG